jgi:signal transduction histidine kinase
MNSCSDGILQMSHDWTILYANSKAVERLSKFEVGSNFWESFPALLGTSIEQNLRKSMAERVLVVYENYYAPDDLWFRAQASPTEEGISLFFTDVTTERSLQNQLSLEQIMREKRIEALTHMAGGLAHEINNPLAIIHASASDLRIAVTSDAPLAREEVGTVCGSIVHASNRAIRVLRALQGFAREAGNDPMQLTQIKEVLERSVQMLEDRFERHRVELRTGIVPELPMVLCRETQILQIVTNLLNNSLDAVQQSKAERWVWLSADTSSDGVEIKVADSGPRSEDQSRPALMDPFFTAKSSGPWMGVGLSLSRTIAQEHGGSLMLEDAGGDTTFRLTLPLPADQHTHALPMRRISADKEVA